MPRPPKNTPTRSTPRPSTRSQQQSPPRSKVYMSALKNQSSIGGRGATDGGTSDNDNESVCSSSKSSSDLAVPTRTALTTTTTSSSIQTPKGTTKGGKDDAGSVKAPWRHPDELDYFRPHDWSEDKIISQLRAVVFTVPKPVSGKQSFIEITVYTSGDFSQPHQLKVPRGYRVPLMFVAKFQWASLKLVLTSAQREKEWSDYKFDILHLSRLCERFFEEAKKACEIEIVEIPPMKMRAAEFQVVDPKAMSRKWRCPTFDRALARYNKNWLISREEFLRDFYIEFEDEEYAKDVLKIDWSRWALKGHKGFKLTQDELKSGIDARHLTRGLKKLDDGGKWVWLDDYAVKQEEVANIVIPPPPPEEKEKEAERVEVLPVTEPEPPSMPTPQPVDQIPSQREEIPATTTTTTTEAPLPSIIAAGTTADAPIGSPTPLPPAAASKSSPTSEAPSESVEMGATGETAETGNTDTAGNAEAEIEAVGAVEKFHSPLSSLPSSTSPSEAPQIRPLIPKVRVNEDEVDVTKPEDESRRSQTPMRRGKNKSKSKSPVGTLPQPALAALVSVPDKDEAPPSTESVHLPTPPLLAPQPTSTTPVPVEQQESQQSQQSTDDSATTGGETSLASPASPTSPASPLTPMVPDVEVPPAETDTGRDSVFVPEEATRGTKRKMTPTSIDSTPNPSPAMLPTGGEETKENENEDVPEIAGMTDSTWANEVEDDSDEDIPLFLRPLFLYYLREQEGSEQAQEQTISTSDVGHSANADPSPPDTPYGPAPPPLPDIQKPSESDSCLTPKPNKTKTKSPVMLSPLIRPASSVDTRSRTRSPSLDEIPGLGGLSNHRSNAVPAILSPQFVAPKMTARTVTEGSNWSIFDPMRSGPEVMQMKVEPQEPDLSALVPNGNGGEEDEGRNDDVQMQSPERVASPLTPTGKGGVELATSQTRPKSGLGPTASYHTTPPLTPPHPQHRTSASTSAHTVVDLDEDDSDMDFGTPVTSPVIIVPMPKVEELDMLPLPVSPVMPSVPIAAVGVNGHGGGVNSAMSARKEKEKTLRANSPKVQVPAQHQEKRRATPTGPKALSAMTTTTVAPALTSTTTPTINSAVPSFTHPLPPRPSQTTHTARASILATSIRQHEPLGPSSSNLNQSSSYLATSGTSYSRDGNGSGNGQQSGGNSGRLRRSSSSGKERERGEREREHARPRRPTPSFTRQRIRSPSPIHDQDLLRYPSRESSQRQAETQPQLNGTSTTTLTPPPLPPPPPQPASTPALQASAQPAPVPEPVIQPMRRIASPPRPLASPRRAASASPEHPPGLGSLNANASFSNIPSESTPRERERRHRRERSNSPPPKSSRRMSRSGSEGPSRKRHRVYDEDEEHEGRSRPEALDMSPPRLTHSRNRPRRNESFSYISRSGSAGLSRKRRREYGESDEDEEETPFKSRKRGEGLSIREGGIVVCKVVSMVRDTLTGLNDLLEIAAERDLIPSEKSRGKMRAVETPVREQSGLYTPILPSPMVQAQTHSLTVESSEVTSLSEELKLMKAEMARMKEQKDKDDKERRQAPAESDHVLAMRAELEALREQIRLLKEIKSPSTDAPPEVQTLRDELAALKEEMRVMHDASQKVPPSAPPSTPNVTLRLNSHTMAQSIHPLAHLLAVENDSNHLPMSIDGTSTVLPSPLKAVDKQPSTSGSIQEPAKRVGVAPPSVPHPPAFFDHISLPVKSKRKARTILSRS